MLADVAKWNKLDGNITIPQDVCLCRCIRENESVKENIFLALSCSVALVNAIQRDKTPLQRVDAIAVSVQTKSKHR